MERSDTTTPPVRRALREQAQRPSHGQASIQTSLPPGFRPRSEDSWIEVSSQPSSSSLSSAAGEIVTEGLQIQHDSSTRRRRRSRTSSALQMHIARRNRPAGDSSQEEYEESESESDRVMSSSNEGLRPSLVHPELRHASEYTSEGEAQEDEDEDDISTAVNYPRNNTSSFTPQPNAFTHPPMAQRPHAASTSYPQVRPTIARSASQRHSYPQQHTPYNMISPSHQADHDAALRASLSTLLSLGAAARGLPKPSQASSRPSTMPSTRVDPSTIRMVPESVVLGSDDSPPSQPQASTASSSFASEPASPLPTTDKPKRKNTASPQPPSSSKDRAANTRALKKARRSAAPSVPASYASAMEDVSPTLLTWVLSAGVLVLVSAIGFSAGYVVGRESGRAEVMGQLGGATSGAVGEAGRCGREAMASEMGRSGMGLRRLRWGGSSSVR